MNPYDSNKTGLVFVKENVNMKKCIIDEDDKSVMRPIVLFRQIFEEAGFKILADFD